MHFYWSFAKCGNGFFFQAIQAIDSKAQLLRDMIDRRQSNGSGERAMTSSTSGAAGGRRDASGKKKDATRKVNDLDLESIDSRKRRKVRPRSGNDV